jgi:hypothetical protein
MSGIPLFTFGQYRNRLIDEIVVEHPSYVVWAYETVWDHGISDGQVKKARRLMQAARETARGPRGWAGYGPGYDKDLDGPRECRQRLADSRRQSTTPTAVYHADGSGYLPASGPCGPLYFDRNGET